MSRSTYKGFFIKDELFKRKKNQRIEIINKNLTILPEYLNKFAHIYNGQTFIYLKIYKNMIGYKFGEFIYTKKKNIFKKKNKK